MIFGAKHIYILWKIWKSTFGQHLGNICCLNVALKVWYPENHQKIIIFGMYILGRSARASARAPMKCKQIDSPDPGDAFWLLDRYSSLKSRIFRKCWKLPKFQNLGKIHFFWSKFRSFDNSQHFLKSRLFKLE